MKSGSVPGASRRALDQFVTFKGDAKQDQFRAVGVFICTTTTEEPTSTEPEMQEFTITKVGGLVIKPGSAIKCASKPAPQPPVTQQFQAFRCKEGAVEEDVTESVIWSVDNPAIGQIEAGTGLFKASVGASGSGKITAQMGGPTPAMGQAPITVVPESGGLAPKMVVICPKDSVDFDVMMGCQEGTIKAAKKGTGDPTFTTDIVVGDVDAIDILKAPIIMRAGGAKEDFIVQVFCNSKPIKGVQVKFSVEGKPANAATVSPAAMKSLANGVASTKVTPKVPSAALHSNRLVAEASGLKERSPFTVVSIDLEIGG
jgi:hypothetical protein